MVNVKDVVNAINSIYNENINPDDCYITTPDNYIDLYVNGRLHVPSLYLLVAPPLILLSLIKTTII